MDSRDKIITAAIEVFAEKGKYGTHMEEIAAKAEINKAMLYYYYTSKDNLFQEVLQRILRTTTEQIIHNLNQGSTTNKNAVEKISQFVTTHFEVLAQNPNFAKIVLDALAGDSKDVQLAMEVIKKDTEMLFPKLLALIEEAISERVFRKIDPLQVFISIIGMNLIYFIGKPIAQTLLDFRVEDEQKFLSDRKDSIIDLLLFGIMSRKP